MSRTQASAIGIQLQVSVLNMESRRCRELKSVSEVTFQELLSSLFQEGLERIRDQITWIVEAESTLGLCHWMQRVVDFRVEVFRRVKL